jgi:outer membrane protein OmpA-like peptidoglycan-associated protein
MVTERCSKLGIHLASLLVAGGLLLSVGATTVFAQGPSESQILNALKPKTRGLSIQPPSAEEQKVIEDLKASNSRGLTVEERNKVAAIAKSKPSIDLAIFFEYNSAEISQKATPDLMNLGRALTNADLQGDTILLGGHTDAKGSDAYNQKLSERRAESVKRFLVDKFRIPDQNLVVVGYGEEQLKNKADPNSAENRRVEITNLAPKASAQK